jgi:hypothetical protein
LSSRDIQRREVNDAEIFEGFLMRSRSWAVSVIVAALLEFVLFTRWRSNRAATA